MRFGSLFLLPWLALISTQAQTLRRTAPQPSQPADLRVNVNLVQANCTATRGKLNQPSDLSAEETEVYEDNNLQPLVAVRRGEDLPLTLTILIDLSGSTAQKWQILREQTAKFILAAMRPGDRVAVLSFADTIRVLANSDHDASPEHLAQLVSTMPVNQGMEVYQRTGGKVNGTRMWDALTVATSALGTMDGRKAIVILTDGMDSASLDKPSSIVQSAQKASVPLYAILTPSPLSMERPSFEPAKLRKAVEQTGGVTFFGEEESVNARLDEFVRILRSQFIVEYKPAVKSSKPKMHRLEIKSTDPHITVHCMQEVYH